MPGKALLAGQGRRERRAFAHLRQRVHRVGAHRAVRERLGRGLQRLQDRDAGAGEHREGAREARRVVAACEPPDQRQLEEAGVEALAERLVAEREQQRRDAAGAGDQQEPAPAAQETADGHHRDRERGQRALRACEHGGDLRHHVGDEEDHDHEGDARHDRRVERGADEPALELLARLEVVGEPLEHDAERAALLARRDHAAVHVVELARRAGERASERRARVDLALQVRDELALALVLRFVAERGERAFERKSGDHEPGDLARPHGERRRVEDTAREAEAGLRRAGRRDLRDGQRHQLLRAQLRARGLGVVGVEEAALGLAERVERLEPIGGHLRHRSGRPGAGPLPSPAAPPRGAAQPHSGKRGGTIIRA